MTDSSLRRLDAANPIDPDLLEIPEPATMRPGPTRHARSRSVRRVLPILGASVVAAGSVAAISLATNDNPDPSVLPRKLAGTPARDLAERIAGRPAVPVGAGTVGAPLIEMLATGGYGVTVSRAWRLPIPGDDRPAWLFAGTKRLALVAPRTSVSPSGRLLPKAASVYGGTATEIAKTGLIGIQSGGGQPFRVLVLIPPGAAAPRIVKADTTTVIRPVQRAGNLYVASPRKGEELYAPSLSAPRQRVSARQP